MSLVPGFFFLPSSFWLELLQNSLIMIFFSVSHVEEGKCNTHCWSGAYSSNGETQEYENGTEPLLVLLDNCRFSLNIFLFFFFFSEQLWTGLTVSPPR